MTNEIKEILDYFRKYMSINDCIRLSKVEDYITNLQEENERLKNKLDNVKASYETEAKYYEYIDKHESKLQQRINKAIEYINKNSYLIQDKEINGIPLLSQRLDKCADLLQILQGK